MPEMNAIAFLNGEYISAVDLSVPVTDTGFVMGVTIAEQLRTFRGVPFWLDRHLERFFAGLEFVGIEPDQRRAEFARIVQRLVAHNFPLCPTGAELGITIFATPGPYPSYGIVGPPTIGIHTYPLEFQLWAQKYESGQKAVIVNERQIPASSWPTRIKCRSRMHYYAATRSARAMDPSATAILLDQDDFVSETPIANVVIYNERIGFRSPPLCKILPGVSLDYLRQLSVQMDVQFIEHDLRAADLYEAEEVLLTSTPFCVLPATQVDDQKISDGKPGAMFHRILNAWGNDVGLNIVTQALSFSKNAS